MSLPLNLYLPRRSWLHAADPRAKLFMVTAGVFALILFRNLPLMLASLLLIHLLYWTAKIPRQRVFEIWRTMLSISALLAGMYILFYPEGEPILTLWIFQITPLAIANGLALGLRIIAVALVVFLWLFTTEQSAIIRGLVKMKIPYDWGLTLSVALRYIPAFQATYQQILEAQQARGLRLHESTGLRRVQLMVPIFVAMVIRILRMSDQLARALDSRAYGAAGYERTSLIRLHFRFQDWVYLFASASFLVVILALNQIAGLGTHPLLLT